MFDDVKILRQQNMLCWRSILTPSYFRTKDRSTHSSSIQII